MPSNVSDFFGRHKLLIGAIFVVLVYAYFMSGVSTNPAGFYVDESCLTYNGYMIATTGTAENGDSFPLYFQCYTQGYSQWANPTHVYLLSLLYLIVPPSNLSARAFAATMVFLAAFLLGLLCRKITGRTAVGVAVWLMALFTPWLFEISRLVLETFFYPLSIAMLLYFVHRASTKEKWTISDNFLIAVALSLITYSYTIGRLLGPLLGLGLLVFATSWRAFFGVVKTGIIYTLTLIPFLVVYLGNTSAITGRFMRATYLDSNKSVFENATTFAISYLSDLNPLFLLVYGDIHPRHHIRGMGGILIGTFVLGMIGVVLILLRKQRGAWWRYVIFGALASIVPGALTTERGHFLRLVAFPVFFMLLTIPAISWLLGDPLGKNEVERENAHFDEEGTYAIPSGTPASPPMWRRVVLYTILAVTVLQAIVFQVLFSNSAGTRGTEFNAAYESILDQALAEGTRPIYLDEGGEPAYIHAYWYGVQKGLDMPSTFVHVLDNEFPPYGALVISSEGSCKDCEMIAHEGSFLLYRKKRPNAAEVTTTKPTPVSPEIPPSLLVRPRGIGIDKDGNRYIADTDNARIQKFDSTGRFVMRFVTGKEEMLQPHGVAVDASGYIYVTESFRHRLLKFNPDGTYLKEYTGPEVGFYGPRDIAVGQNGKLYIVDQGRTRIVVFDPTNEQFTSFGTPGSGQGQLVDPTGIDVAGGNIFVADTGNNRVQVFDLDGRFIREWAVPQWQKNIQTFPDIAFDPTAKLAYVSNGSTFDVFVFDINGKQVGSIRPAPITDRATPASLAISDGPGGRQLLVLHIGNGTTPVPAETAVFAASIEGKAGK